VIEPTKSTPKIRRIVQAIIVVFEKDGLLKNVPLACYSTRQRADAIGATLSIAEIEKVILLYLVNQFKDISFLSFLFGY